jgi:anti-anti-sigma factor
MLKPTVQIHNVDGILVAEFWDCLRLDPAPVNDLRSLYEAHVQKQGRPELVIDLSGVGFAGSAALGNFVALHRLVRQKGGRIIFTDVDPTVAEVFRASKLESLFEFVADRSAALRAITEHPGTHLTDGLKSTEKDPARSPTTPRTGLSRLRRRNPESGGKAAQG